MSAPPDSTASYIIICGGRIAAAADPNNKTHRIIKAASDCAVNLVTYLAIRLKYEIKPEHTKEISAAQHYMMDHLVDMKTAEAEDRAAKMFALLYALEHQFEGY